VTLSEFKGRSLVSIREFYVKDGKEMPSAKGDSTMAPWITARMLDVMSTRMDLHLQCQLDIAGP
jgi:hypothetical protein